MNRRRPTDAQADALTLSAQREEAKRSSPWTQATSPTPMLVDVDKIVPYDRNPRRAPNVKRDNLKAYIREAGFNQVLTITQRPDTDRPDIYMIGVGGNTRLQIIQKLWKETGDERFRQVWCQFQPWASEAHTLVSHIQDNDLRGDLVFIDRALAVHELRDLLEAETGKTLSQRALRDRLAERGYPISRTMIIWYQYTVDTLYPLIPTLLQTGMGRTTIARIHEMQRAFGKAWQSMSLGGTEEATNLFEQTLQRHDGEVLDLGMLRRDLEEELSVSADCDIQRASLEFGGALYGRSGSEADATPVTKEPVDNTPQEAVAAPESASTAQTPSDRHEPAKPPTTRDDKPADNPAWSHNSEPEPPRPASPALAETAQDDHHYIGSAEAPEPQADPAMPSDLKSLRGRTWMLACRIAQGSRLGDVIVSIQNGLGFLVGPIAVDTQQTWHPDTARGAMCVWWHLATLAEQFARHGQACAHMPDSWQQRCIGDAMRQARNGQQAFSQWQWAQADRALFADVPPLEPNDMGPMLYHRWPEQRWQDWIQLVATYRAIYRITGDAPWGEA